MYGYASISKQMLRMAADYSSDMRAHSPLSDVAAFPAPAPAPENLQLITRVRKYFPETWIWTTDVFAGYDKNFGW